MKRHDISISWLSYDMNTTGHNSVPGNVIYVFYHNDTLCSKKSDAEIQITILSELNILLAAFIIIFPT